MRFILVILFNCICIGLTAQTSYIQIVSEPDISVFLDGAFKGKTTSEIGGLIIENISPGNHIIKVIKEGYNPQMEQINVKLGEVMTYSVKPFVPTIKITQKGNTENQQINLQVGKINIQSLPVAINIKIPKLGIVSSKTKDLWTADEIPVGEYDIIFEWNGKILYDTFQIGKDFPRHLLVNMIKGRIDDKSISISTEQKLPSETAETFTDPKDSIVYRKVKIGSQIWMAENLKAKTYNNGDLIETNTGRIKTRKVWDPLPYNQWTNGDKFNKTTYGRSYTWHVATDPRGLCPVGWHLPSIKEYTALVNYLGGEYIAGGKLKDKGNEHWIMPNVGATNFSGFSALPGGKYHDNYGKFEEKGINAFFWAADEGDGLNAGYLLLKNTEERTFILPMAGKSYGFSVRCIKD